MKSQYELQQERTFLVSEKNQRVVLRGPPAGNSFVLQVSVNSMLPVNPSSTDNTLSVMPLLQEKSPTNQQRATPQTLPLGKNGPDRRSPTSPQSPSIPANALPQPSPLGKMCPTTKSKVLRITENTSVESLFALLDLPGPIEAWDIRAALSCGTPNLSFPPYGQLQRQSVTSSTVSHRDDVQAENERIERKTTEQQLVKDLRGLRFPFMLALSDKEYMTWIKSGGSDVALLPVLSYDPKMAAEKGMNDPKAKIPQSSTADEDTNTKLGTQMDKRRRASSVTVMEEDKNDRKSSIPFASEFVSLENDDETKRNEPISAEARLQRKKEEDQKKHNLVLLQARRAYAVARIERKARENEELHRKAAEEKEKARQEKVRKAMEQKVGRHLKLQEHFQKLSESKEAVVMHRKAVFAEAQTRYQVMLERERESLLEQQNSSVSQRQCSTLSSAPSGSLDTLRTLVEDIDSKCATDTQVEHEQSLKEWTQNKEEYLNSYHLAIAETTIQRKVQFKVERRREQIEKATRDAAVERSRQETISEQKLRSEAEHKEQMDLFFQRKRQEEQRALVIAAKEKELESYIERQKVVLQS